MSLKEFLGGLIAELSKGSQAPNLPEQNQQPSVEAAPEQAANIDDAHTGEATETTASSEVSPERLSTVNRVYIDVSSFEITIDAAPPGASPALVVLDDKNQVMHIAVTEGTLYLTKSEHTPRLTATQLRQQVGMINYGSGINISGGNITLTDIQTDGDIVIRGNSTTTIGGSTSTQLQIRSGTLLTPAFMRHISTERSVVKIHLLLPGEREVAIVTPDSSSTVSVPKSMSREEKITYIQTIGLPEIKQELEEKIRRKQERAQEKIANLQEKAARKKADAMTKQAHYEQKALEKEAKARGKQQEAAAARQQGKMDKARDKESDARDAIRDAEGHRRDGVLAYQDKLRDARGYEQEIPSVRLELEQTIKSLTREATTQTEQLTALLKQLQ